MTQPGGQGRDAGVPAGPRPGAPEGEAGRPVPLRPPRPERRIAAAFGLTAAAAVGFAAVYWTGGQTQLEGVLLAAAFAGLAYGLGAWSARLMPQGPFVEEHEPFASSRRQRAAFAAEFEEDLEAISRRRFLGRALALPSPPWGRPCCSRCAPWAPGPAGPCTRPPGRTAPRRSPPTAGRCGPATWPWAAS
jgi:hypothetical protein